MQTSTRDCVATASCLCLLQPKGVPRRFTPILMGVREEAVDGAYTLVLEFAKRKVGAISMCEWSWVRSLHKLLNASCACLYITLSHSVVLQLDCLPLAQQFHHLSCSARQVFCLMMCCRSTTGDAG